MQDMTDITYKTALDFNSNISVNLSKYSNYKFLTPEFNWSLFLEFPLLKTYTICVTFTPFFAGLSMWRASALVVQKFES